MKKVVLKIAIVCLLALSLCFSAFGGNAAAENTSGSASASESASTADKASDDGKMHIFFYPVNTATDNYGNLIPDGSGKVSVGVRINGQNDGVRLTIRTRDKSALAAEGDYEEQSKEVRLVSTGSADSSFFTVQTNKTNAANLISSDASGYNAAYGLTRVFEILLCDIKTDSGREYVVHNDYSSEKTVGSTSFDVRLQTGYDYEYSGKTGKNGLYFTDYLYGKTFAARWFDRNNIYSQTPSGDICVSVDEDTKYSKDFERFIAYDYILKYRNTGWADVYYGGSATISESGWCTVDTPATLKLTGKESKNEIFFSQYYDPKSSGAPILFGETGYSNNSDSYRYNLTESAKTWINNHTGYTVINADDPMYSHAYCYYTRKNYNFASVTGRVYKDNSETLNLEIKRDSTWDMDFKYLRIDSELYDANSPVIEKMSLSDLTTTDNKTLRLSVRFSEPVHLPTDLTEEDRKNLTVRGYANNLGSLPLDFFYAGGEGSDTLYFDCDLGGCGVSYKTAPIQNITFRKGDSFGAECKGISDYAYNFDLSNNFADLTMSEDKSFSVSIDMREPSVRSKILSDKTAAAQTHVVNVYTENMAAAGSKLYYAWVKTSELGDKKADEYSPKTYANCETANPISVTVIGEKLDGEYYLYYMAESAYGTQVRGHTDVLKFDNTAAEISSLSADNPNAALSERTVTLKLKGRTDDLAEITMKYRAVGETEWKQKKIYSPGGKITGEDTISSFKYDEETDESKGTFKLSGTGTFGMATGEGKKFYFKFVTVDEANNSAEYEAEDAYRFDTSERCPVQLDITGEPYIVYDEIKTTTAAGIKEKGDSDYKNSYKNSYYAEGFSLKFVATESSEITLSSLYKGNDNVTDSKDDYFDFDNTDGNCVMSYKSETDGHFSGGYFSVQMTADGKNSEVFTFFLAGSDDETDGYVATTSDKLVVSKVWKAGDVSYYWMSDNKEVKSEKYNGTNLPLAFSSRDMAIQYYEYMEKQDLSLFYISTENDANALNKGYSDLRKATADENTTAEAGQTWIRYKSTAWDQSNESTKWNYYFYSRTEETEINVSKLSGNLSAAIKSVATRIADKGSYVYLADDGLNDRGIIELDPSRIKPDNESFNVAKNGQTFATSVSFGGDGGIYSPTYKTENGEEYPFAVQKLTVGEYSSFYFRSHGGGKYEKLNVSGSFYLKDKINGTGIYDIIERGVKGIRQYSVYIDNSSPEISVIYDNNKGEETLTISKDDAKTISSLNVKSFSFDALSDTDEFAYVAVFTSGGKYQGAYLADELAGISLKGGSYVIKAYDRSGNGFELSLRISDADLESSCNIVPKPDDERDDETDYETYRSVRFTCKYPKDDIYRFEIYLDGILLVDSADSLKSNSITFKDGGKYRFYVEDIFGNVYDKETTLVISAPQVTWYYKQNGDFVAVREDAEETVGFVMTKLGSSSYSVTTNGAVKFRYPAGDDYVCEFLSGSGRETSSAIGYKEVAIDETDNNWQVKIYYKSSPDLYVIYSGKSDSSAPTISVVTNRAKYSYADEAENAVENYFKTHDVKIGGAINFDDVSFSQTDVVTETVKNGEIVTGSLVTVRISDLSGIYKWSCTYNGEVAEYKGDQTEKAVFGKEGSYVIEAIDKIGNVSTYSFTIGRSEFTELNVDDDGGKDKKNGNKNVIASLTGAGEFVFVVDGENSVEYFRLITDGTYLKRVILKVARQDDKFYAVEEEIVLSEALSSKPIIIKETDLYYVRAFAGDGKIFVEAALAERKENETHTIGVKFRVRSEVVGDCKLTAAELSDRLSYMNYVLGGKTDVLDETLKVNEKITLTRSDDVILYEIGYSETDEFGSLEKNVDDYDCDKTGYYLVVAYNKYGNSSKIKIIYHVGISVVGVVGYADGEKITYVDYDGDLYSNDFVSLRIYKDVDYAVRKDGADYVPAVTCSDAEKIVTVRENGEFEFSFTDNFGNKKTTKVTILTKDLDYSDGWLYGFSENAKRKSEGYTKDKVRFDGSRLISDGVKSIIVATPDGEKVTVYDDVTATKSGFDDNYVVGDDGDGEYEIIFRDIYGNKAVKSVRYRSTSTLTASRLTRSMEKQSYAVDDTIAGSGVWSNKTITLTSEASESEFTVNSEKRNLPYSFGFPSESDSGKYEYVVKYVDEYGFSFEFSCVLYRRTIEVAPSGMEVNDGITKDPVAVTFDDEYSAEISVNGESLGSYKSGTQYFRDGSYVISVRDVAGNVTNYSVRRDSVADFCFYAGTLDKKLVSGEIVNESVRFAPLNGDAVSYYSVYRDGKEIENYDSTIFNESGKWEIVLKDEIGNKDYFCFYLITHSLKEFAYATPRGFRITEITHDAGGGKVSWLDAVEDRTDYSYIDFYDSGEYEVTMKSDLTGKTSGFTIAIDKSVPKIVLSGAENGGVTKQNVTIGGCKEGDTVYIYKDGVLSKEIRVTASSDVPEINEKGKYTVVVVNEAGGSSQAEFTRVYTANVATSALIIVVILAVVAGLFTGLLFRKHSRIE